MQQCSMVILKTILIGLIIWRGYATLQDKTGGFNAFIPLKYKKSNNSMSYLGEVNTIEDLRNYAVSRIYLDNFPHIKAYWPMTGKEVHNYRFPLGQMIWMAQLMIPQEFILWQVQKRKSPSMSTDEICKLIRSAGFIPVERDSLYNTVLTKNGNLIL